MRDDRNEPENRAPDDAPDPLLAAAFAGLPRVAPLAPGEEDRTVAALRAAGLLPAVRSAPAIRPWLRRDSPAWRRTARVAVGLAASLALFAAGAFWGEARMSSRTLEAILSRPDSDARTAAVLVQRAGSAYVTSVADLADLAEHRRTAGNAGALAQGREAAHSVLRAAAAQVAALDPADPLARAILSDRPADAGGPRQGVVWF